VIIAIKRDGKMMKPRPFLSRTLLSLLLSIPSFFSLVINSGCTNGGQEKIPKIAIVNYMNYPILNDSIEGIKRGLSNLGYKQGKNINIIEFNANGETDKLGLIAREVISIDADVIVPVSTPVAQIIINTVPHTQQVVFSTVTNPNDVDIKKRLPNVTGVSDVVNYEANIKLIRELFPEKKKIGFIYNPGEKNSVYGAGITNAICNREGLELVTVTISNSNEIFGAASSLASAVDLFYVGSDNTVVSGIGALLKVAYEKQMPVISSDSGSVLNGSLAAISVNYSDLGIRVAELIDEVLKGKKAGEIPNIFFEGKDLLINMKAAKSISFTFPEKYMTDAKTIVN